MHGFSLNIYGDGADATALHEIFDETVRKLRALPGVTVTGGSVGSEDAGAITVVHSKDTEPAAFGTAPKKIRVKK